MVKTIEELNQIKKECDLLKAELKELSEDELNVVTGGLGPSAFFGLIFEFPRDEDPKSFVDPGDQNIISELPKIKDDERYVK